MDFSVDDKILAALGKSVPKSSSNSSVSASFSRLSSSGPKAEELPRSRSSFSPRRDLKIKRTVLPANWRDSLDEDEPAKPAAGRSATTGRSGSVPKDWRSSL